MGPERGKSRDFGACRDRRDARDRWKLRDVRDARAAISARNPRFTRRLARGCEHQRRSRVELLAAGDTRVTFASMSRQTSQAQWPHRLDSHRAKPLAIASDDPFVLRPSPDHTREVEGSSPPSPTVHNPKRDLDLEVTRRAPAARETPSLLRASRQRNTAPGSQRTGGPRRWSRGGGCRLSWLSCDRGDGREGRLHRPRVPRGPRRRERRRR